LRERERDRHLITVSSRETSHPTVSHSVSEEHGGVIHNHDNGDKLFEDAAAAPGAR